MESNIEIMYQLYRLLSAFISGDISVRYFCDEFTLINWRYREKLDELEISEFNLSYSKELDEILDKLCESCSRYNPHANEYEISHHYSISNEVLEEAAQNAYDVIIEKKLIVL